MWEIMLAWGMPATLFSAVVGIVVWWFKRFVAKQEEERKEREKNTENLILLIIQTSKATNVLAEATARAVQRIPDAHCNGDMTAALEKAAAIQQAEEKFMMDQGIKRIFGDNH